MCRKIDANRTDVCFAEHERRCSAKMADVCQGCDKVFETHDSKAVVDALLGMQARNKLLREELDRQDAVLRQLLHEFGVNNLEKAKNAAGCKRELFRQDIDVRSMAEAMHVVYEKLVGSGKDGQHCIKPIDLIAYLYVMVDLQGYGRYDFRSNGKRPFFEFFMHYVKPELQDVQSVTYRTMYNRINNKFDCLYLSQEDKRKQSDMMKNMNRSIERAYKVVVENFNKTKFGRTLLANARTSAEPR